jgi:hypothetical protein
LAYFQLRASYNVQSKKKYQGLKNMRDKVKAFGDRPKAQGVREGLRGWHRNSPF